MDEASAVVRVVGVGVGECRAVGGDDPEQRRDARPGQPVMYAGPGPGPHTSRPTDHNWTLCCNVT